MMSSFAKKLGFKKDKNETSPSSAIAKLREMETLFVKKQEHLELKIKLELDCVKANGKSNKRVAIQALKRKRRFEQQLQQIDGTLTTIELQREALESVNTNTTILTTMKLAADVLKEAHNKMNIDEVHEMIDDISEQQLLAKELAEAVAAPRAQDEDETELLKELEELEQEELNRHLLDFKSTEVDAAEALPSVPISPLPGTSRQLNTSKDEIEDELKKLEEWAL